MSTCVMSVGGVYILNCVLHFMISIIHVCMALETRTNAIVIVYVWHMH